MTKMTYSEQLRHPKWQRKRLEVLADANFACEACGDTETTLNVHHKRYVKGRMAWEYEREELACMCRSCHLQEHEERDLLERLLMSGEASMAMAIGLLAGYLEGGLSLHEDLEADARRIGGPYLIAGQIGQLLERHNWRSVGESLRAFVVERGAHLNPAEEMLVDFLCQQPEPAKDL